MQKITELVKGCVNQEKQAQEHIFNRYYPVLLGLLFRYTNSMEDAEDLLQETFVKIFSSIGSLKNPESIEGWMKRIATNTAITFLRKKQKFTELNKEIPDIVPEEDDDPNWAFSFSPEDLFKEISSLPVGYRTVMNLFAIENYSHKEIAQQLNISENTSRTQYMKAKAFLKKKLLIYNQQGC